MAGFVEDGKEEAFSEYVAEHYQANTGITPQIYPSLAADGAGILPF